MSVKLKEVAGEIVDEAQRAQDRWGDLASMHEGYGVLCEEVAELLEAIRLRQENPERGPHIEKEATQVAAVALRMAAQARRVTR